MRSLIVRVVRVLLLPSLLATGAVLHTAVQAEGRGGGGSKCTGEACPCVYTGGGPTGSDRICPM